ncbi:MAG: GntR family transcriptional regulator [Rhizobiaceae bacterium]|nr:GntR family transcriptional regulator [Rhizobiaceae bacterium]
MPSDTPLTPQSLDASFSLPPGRVLDICVRLQNAILAQRLKPGAKLSEDEVGEIFSSSRTVIRAALQALAHTGLVEIKKNRGAYVAKPTIINAHEVFEARTLIEPEVTRRAAKNITAEDLKKLTKHIEAEHLALASNDISKALALSGIFHIAIANIASHAVYSNIVQSLITQSSLIIALYAKRPDTACESHSHAALLEAFAKGDGEAAAAIMQSHLVDLHSGLNLRTLPVEQPSLAKALAGI